MKRSAKSQGKSSQCEGEQGLANNILNDFQVFFNTLNQKVINETKTYDPDLQNGGSLWSSLGGVLSLFLGVSFAMFFEVISCISKLN